jgi:hypothetical protein
LAVLGFHEGSVVPRPRAVVTETSPFGGSFRAT